MGVYIEIKGASPLYRVAFYQGGKKIKAFTLTSGKRPWIDNLRIKGERVFFSLKKYSLSNKEEEREYKTFLKIKPPQRGARNKKGGRKKWKK